MIRRCVSILAGLVAAALLASACTTAPAETVEEPEETAIELGAPPRRFVAEWLVDAEAIGVEGPGFPYLYREVVDDAVGRYLVQSPQHVALQQPDRVVFCAAIFRSDPYCASTPRPEDTPPVYSYAVQLLRTTWSPSRVYELASWRELDLVANADPDAWDRRPGLVSEINVECFIAVADTPAAPTGFEVCFVDDDTRLLASVDLQGDGIFEIDLQTYQPGVVDDDFDTGMSEWFEETASLQEQLLGLFPDIPAPRPTPTPDLGDAEDAG